LAWGDAAPIKFVKNEDAWDFKIVMREADECNISGCVLASAFFPDAGRHELVLYPKMFTQDREEQVETLIHEIGHMFGLRHFFAQVRETAWPAEVFGKHRKFSIMNYGEASELTTHDKSDLKKLYQLGSPLRRSVARSRRAPPWWVLLTNVFAGAWESGTSNAALTLSAG